MALPLPTSLTPSKVAAFKDCALAFRFSVIDGLPEPPSAPAVKGTLVHRVLQLLLQRPPAERHPAGAGECLAQARRELAADAEYAGLDLEPEAEAAFAADAEELVRGYFQLEDPSTVRPIGLETQVDLQLGSLRLRGIIDRLELDDDGGLVVTDYKTGRAPTVAYEQSRLGGVHFYAFLCERVFGRRPSRIQLLHLREPLAILAYPTEQSTRGLHQRTVAIWQAVERACEREDFRPRPSRLCEWCSYQAWCPAFGGDPSQARSGLLAAAAG